METDLRAASTIGDAARRSVSIYSLPAALKGSAQQFGSIKKVPAALETPLTGPFPTTHEVKVPVGGRDLLGRKGAASATV